MKSLETVLDFSSLQNTWHPDTSRKTQSIWLPMKSFRNTDTHTHIVCWTDLKSNKLIFWREELPWSCWSIKWYEIHLFLSLLICMYVLGRNILSQSCCSLCSYACIGLPGPAHPPKVKYSLRSDKLHCLFPSSYKQRENISLWEGVLVLEGQYIHTSRESNSFETEYFCPIHIHMSKERESKQATVYMHK